MGQLVKRRWLTRDLPSRRDCDRRVEQEAKADIRKASAALEEYDQNGGISLEDLREELGLREPQRPPA